VDEVAGRIPSWMGNLLNLVGRARQTAVTTVTKFSKRLGHGMRIVERGTLLEKGFSTVGTKLIHVPRTGTHVPRTWNVAPYHVSSDYGCDPISYPNATHLSIAVCLAPWAIKEIDKRLIAFLWSGSNKVASGHALFTLPVAKKKYRGSPINKFIGFIKKFLDLK
jgi:hypothetical protein